jgi:NADPH:quinone reductase-like Zn-dependent oxidoreductase/malonyl CoA-acyl carrier protein transacylase/short-subunit dehydrogenase/acyl carrier protein
MAGALADPAEFVRGQAVSAGRLAFAYSGNGAQFAGMARDAWEHSQAFRAGLTALDECMAPLLGWSVRDRLLDNDAATLQRTDVAQPLLFAVQVAITQALRARGIEPEVTFGHSVGEIAAAWAAGALPLETACRVVVARSRQQQRTQGLGGMAALSLDEGAVPDLDGIEVAAWNSRTNITVAGSHEAMARLKAQAADRGWRHIGLDLDYAFHSSLLDPIEADLLDELGAIDAHDCGERFVSTVTGETARGLDLDAHYWWRNVRHPVLFRQAAAAITGRGIRILVEIGPSPILQSYLRDALRAADADGRVLATLTRQPAGNDPFEAIAAGCYVAGHDPSALAVFDGPADVAGLPRYPWQREDHWFPVTPDAVSIAHPRQDHPLLGFRRDAPEGTWLQTLDLALQPWLADHAVEGMSVLPAAAMLELVVAAMRVANPEAALLAVDELEIRQALALEEGRARTMRVRQDASGAVMIESRPRLADEDWTLHAVARPAPDTGAEAPEEQSLPAAQEVVDADALYAHAENVGLTYGPQFRSVSRVEIFDRDNAFALLEPRGSDGVADYILPPPLMDGGLQAFLAMSDADGEFTLLPWRMTGVKVFAPFGRVPRSVRLSVTRRGGRSACGALVYHDAAGRAVAEIGACWFRKVRLTRSRGVADQAFHFALAAKPLPGCDDAPALEPAVLLDAEKPAGGGDSALLLEAYVASAARHALLEAVPVDTPFEIREMVRQGTIAADAVPLLVTLLRLLARHGAAEEDRWQWRLLAESDMPEPSLIWRTILADAPALGGELALAAGAFETLPAFLRWGRAAGPAPALLEQFLYASPDGRRVLDAMHHAVLRHADGWPRGRPLRILEIGAGPGILARQLLDALSGWHGTVRYVAADGDASRTARLAAQFKGIPGADAITWDGSGELPERFDIVLSVYGFTLGGVDETRMGHVRRALATNGLLFAAEPEPGPLWDWIFGQQEGWWQGGVASEFPVSRLRCAADWQADLACAGFVAPCDRMLDGFAWPVNLIAARRANESAATGDPPPAAVIVAMPDDSRAAALAEILKAAGTAVAQIALPGIGAGDALRDSPDVSDIVVLPSAGADDPVAATNARLMEVLDTARTIAAVPARARLWIVTEGAQQLSGQIAEDAALWGLGRTIANEMPQLECRLVDLHDGLAPRAAAEALLRELMHRDNETEIVLLPEGRHVMRLRRGTGAAAVALGPVKLAVATPGRLDSVAWVSQKRRKPAPGEVAIDVRAVDVNFRDVMWSLDLLPEEALLDGYGGPTLGLACAGVVTAVGDGVTDIKAGDRVLATAPACFASEAIAARHTVATLPDGLDFCAAATLPVAFITVLYALGHLADLRPGETVLIHGGAGGVGIAAIQYAKYRGATVIATAGSPAKRAFVKQMGADHVLDSRSLSFADGVRALTGGAGVDVVLNSLSGEAMEQSLGLVRPFGRFLELGKRDFFTGTRVGLRPLRRNVSYFAVDVDALPLERPALASALMEELMTLTGQGVLRPLPYRLFQRSEVGEAFRLMQAAGHIGKIILSMEDARKPAGAAPAIAPFVVREDGTYLITGGLGGFGLATAEWLAKKGARFLALLGRRGLDTPGAAEALARLGAEGVDARAFAVDITDAAALEAALEQLRRDMPPLRGVVHAAMTLQDGLLADLDAEKNARVLSPKLGGALNLDRLTRGDLVEVFLLYASATTVLGAPGQGNYVAANFALEGLARRRRAEGLPAFVVGWGPIADAGFLARNVEMRETLARRLAAEPMRAIHALDALPELMAGGELSVAFAAVRWDTARRMLPVLDATTFRELLGDRAEIGESELRDRLMTLPPEERRDLLLMVLKDEIGRILSQAAETLDPHRPVSELGMDSLMAVELRLALEQRIGINLPMFALSPQTSLSMIAARLERQMGADHVATEMAVMAARYEPAAASAVELVEAAE